MRYFLRNIKPKIRFLSNHTQTYPLPLLTAAPQLLIDFSAPHTYDVLLGRSCRCADSVAQQHLPKRANSSATRTWTSASGNCGEDGESMLCHLLTLRGGFVVSILSIFDSHRSHSLLSKFLKWKKRKRLKGKISGPRNKPFAHISICRPKKIK